MWNFLNFVYFEMQCNRMPTERYRITLAVETPNSSKERSLEYSITTEKTTNGFVPTRIWSKGLSITLKRWMDSSGSRRHGVHVPLGDIALDWRDMALNTLHYLRCFCIHQPVNTSEDGYMFILFTNRKRMVKLIKPSVMGKNGPLAAEKDVSVVYIFWLYA